MMIVRTQTDLQSLVSAWKKSGLRVGFVPTMGALHAGHLSLVDHAVRQCDRVIASIFVNPTQFAAHEDLDTYPRHESEDVALLGAHGCALAYCPDVTTMYPEGEETRVNVPALGAKLEGEFRPHFFGGVATIVSKLFNQVSPDKAYFGEKDFQQVQVIRRMVKDLAFPIEIIAVPTERAADGLALSSRNAYLSPTERRIAPCLFAAMTRAGIRIRQGVNAETALGEARETLKRAGFDKIDYLAACDPATLDPVSFPISSRPARLLAAVWLGKTRLIDNISI